MGVDGICRWVGRGWGRPWASAAVGADGQGRRSTVLVVALVKIKFKLHPQQLILKLITLYSPHSVIFNDFESLFFLIKLWHQGPERTGQRAETENNSDFQ